MKFSNLNYIIIPNNIVCEIINLKMKSLIWFSGNFGTWFYEVPKNYDAILRKNIIFFKKHNIQLVSKLYNIKKIRCKNLQNFTSYLQILIFSVSSGFKRVMKIRGRGYKYMLTNNHNVEIQAGLAHKIYFKNLFKMKLQITPKGKTIRLKLKSLLSLKPMLIHLRKRRVPNYLSGKGIRFLRDIAQKKTRSPKRK